MIKIKANSTYKGRLVVEGFSQIPSVDCDDTFAPVYRPHSIHRTLAIAAELDYEVLRGRYTSSYIVILGNATIIFKVAL